MDIKPEIKIVNARLKVDLVRVRIEARGDRLVLQATLPPRPGSAKAKPSQQRISLGLPANRLGLRRAERLARLLGIQLVEGKFTWEEWAKPKEPVSEDMPAREVIEAFKKAVGLSDFYWRERWWYRGLNKLPLDVPVTADAIVAAVLTKEPDTRSRQVACERLGEFAKFAGVAVDLSPFVGNYGRGSVVPRELPSDDEIEAVLQGIDNQQWRNVFWVMAVFGCRDHEVFFSRLQTIGGVMALSVMEGKTGPRFPVMPMPGHWLDYIDLDNLPELGVVEHAEFGRRCAQAWRRQTKDVPWAPYDLRRCYAVRCHVKGIPTALVAKWMGHSELLNASVYRRWINQDMHIDAWSRAQG